MRQKLVTQFGEMVLQIIELSSEVENLQKQISEIKMKKEQEAGRQETANTPEG